MNTNNPTNLYEYYTKQGKNLPSVQERAPIYEQFGLGKAGDYTGSAEQNTALLGKLAGTPSQLVVTSGQSRTKTNEAMGGLQEALAKLNSAPGTGATEEKGSVEGTDQDPILQGLSKLQSTSDAAQKSLLSTITAQYANEKNKVNEQFGNYKAGLQELGIQTNQAQATPDLLMGHIQKAGADQLEKINSLTAEESKALMDASAAKEANDFKTLTAKMDYIKQIKKDKADAIKEMYDNISNSTKIAQIQAHDIYDTMQTLDPADQESFIQAVAKKYNLSVVSLVQALKDEKTSRESDALDTENKKSIIADRNKPTGGDTSTPGGKGGGTSGTYKYSADDLNNYYSLLDTGGTGPDGRAFNPRGEDGFVDPYAYKAIFEDWTSHGGTAANFLTKFPIKTNVNPESYKLLPEAIRPAEKKTTKERAPLF